MVAVNASFFSDMLQSIADRSRALIRRERREPARGRLDGLVELCEALLSGRGEASGVALANEILADYAALTTGPRIAFFEALARTFGYDTARIEAAIAAWRQSQSADAAAELHRASEPRRLELFRRLNLAPGGTAALVRMREQLMDAMDHRDDLAVIDNDFVHLFSSWFNRGFLVLRRIDWSTSASILEKIIRYEAVHEIHDWEDLRRRIDLPDRRCYAFFHPALVDEPLIFVEVALTREIPDAIAPILSDKRELVDPERADDGGVLLHHQLPARTCRRDVRPLPDQAGGGGSPPRMAAHLDLRHAVAGAEFRRMAQARTRLTKLRLRTSRPRIAKRLARSIGPIGGSTINSSKSSASR